MVEQKRKNALIIGGAGFVGGYLVRELLAQGQTVTLTKMEQEQVPQGDYHVKNLNLLDTTEVENVITEINPDFIFHLAAQSSVALSWKNPTLTVDVNIKGSLNLLECLKKISYTGRVLMIGSGEEYGKILPEEVPIQEDTVLRPGNIYAATKGCQNMLATIYAGAYDLNLIMVRAFNHVGPNQSPQFVVADFCKQVAEIERGKKEPVIHVGNLAAKRDFTDVRDVVRAYVSLIEKGIPGETYNVGSGNAYAIEEILQKIRSKAKKEITVDVDPKKLRPIDVPLITADISKLQRDTGWKPEISLDQTIEDTLQYWRETL